MTKRCGDHGNRLEYLLRVSTGKEDKRRVTTNVRPVISDLLLSASPDLFHIVEDLTTIQPTFDFNAASISFAARSCMPCEQLGMGVHRQTDLAVSQPSLHDSWDAFVSTTGWKYFERADNIFRRFYCLRIRHSRLELTAVNSDDTRGFDRQTKNVKCQASERTIQLSSARKNPSCNAHHRRRRSQFWQSGERKPEIVFRTIFPFSLTLGSRQVDQTALKEPTDLFIIETHRIHGGGKYENPRAIVEVR